VKQRYIHHVGEYDNKLNLKNKQKLLIKLTKLWIEWHWSPNQRSCQKIFQNMVFTAHLI